jgi:hypothetical protein
MSINTKALRLTLISSDTTLTLETPKFTGIRLSSKPCKPMSDNSLINYSNNISKSVWFPDSNLLNWLNALEKASKNYLLSSDNCIIINLKQSINKGFNKNSLNNRRKLESS